MQGSRTLGLGHLSRIVPVYQFFKNNGYKIRFYFHGDDLGESYLSQNSIDYFTSSSKTNFKINASEIWIVDSTNIYEEYFEKLLSQAGKVILLSPKFCNQKLGFISHCIIRSDPFHLNVKSKYVGKEFFTYNKGSFEKFESKLSLSLVLSGGQMPEAISAVLQVILDDRYISSYFSKIRVFLGSASNISFVRDYRISGHIDLEFISSIRSIWSFKRKSDLFIVGNGLIVDECIQEKQDFILYNFDKKNLKIKSFEKELVLQHEAKSISSLKVKLLEYCSKTNNYKYSGILPKQEIEYDSPLLHKLKEIIER